MRVLPGGMAGCSGRRCDVSEPGASEDAATLAAEDQALASARHLASCVVRHYRELREGNVPRFERLVFTAIWLNFFASPESDEDDGDE